MGADEFLACDLRKLQSYFDEFYLAVHSLHRDESLDDCIDMSLFSIFSKVRGDLIQLSVDLGELKQLGSSLNDVCCNYGARKNDRS